MPAHKILAIAAFALLCQVQVQGAELLTDTDPLLDHFTITLKSPYNQSLNQVS